MVEGRGRLLVVQKTGCGKSFVYFIATKLLRNAGAGPGLLVSPLLSLMRNQLAAAQRMGLRAATINSDNQADWDAVEAQLQANAVDILLIVGLSEIARAGQAAPSNCTIRSLERAGSDQVFA